MQGIIFDLDGTLLDSMPIWEDIASRYIRQKGYEPKEGLDKIIYPMSMMQAAIYMKKEYGLKETPKQMIIEVNEIVGDFYRYEVKAKPGVEHFLAEGKKQGIRMCIATASERELVEAALKRLGMESYFEGILTCSELHTGKDTPEIYYKGMALLGTNQEDTLIYEDALHAIETAVQAGFTVIGVYDDSAKKEQALIRTLANRYITSFEEETIHIGEKKVQKREGKER